MAKFMKLIGKSRAIFASVLCFLFCVLLVPAAFAAPEPTVQIGVVAQRFPWNGVVDVTCKVALVATGIAA